MRLGFVGLGSMGLHMARRLCDAGHELVVFDLNDAAVQTLVDAGAKRADSVSELANQVECGLVCLPTPDIVDTVLIGEGGLGAGSVRTIVDLSTSGPSAAQRIGAELGRRGIRLVDAPVSGGTIGAEAGTLTIMISGEDAAYHDVRLALEAIGKNLFYLGGQPGLAQLMKLINNTLCAVSAISAFEGLVLGAKAGLDPQTMLDVINVSSGQSFATSIKIPQCVVNRSFPPRFTSALLDKDVRLCLAEAERLGVTMPISQQTRQFIAFALSQGYGDQDYGNLIKIFEGWAGTQFGTQTAQEPVA
ncbi:NAD(P)-dependent oxidoreductase [Sphingobium sp. SCG-1]|uniref:NAD(P)-dependent oxidoreductase n=1 Tax=Sphingobium sp. SCG-1 TaxID=2072936 RepID=UPI000CD6AC4F|nr:NAD(P)-dependent oxidoreductase [Sphingobium sp. SCG-1]AUW60429.1 NAD(P)-dependent oxidoreductase [Sphingobium sp. SCG-1]